MDTCSFLLFYCILSHLKQAWSNIFTNCVPDRHMTSQYLTQQSGGFGSRGGSRLPFSLYSFLKRPALKHLQPSDVEVLDAHGCFHVPGGHFMDIWIRHYFLYVHPCLPLFDEARFWKMYRHPEEFEDHFSLLLFQSMIFSATSVSSALVSH
jgi:hypothetical protein